MPSKTDENADILETMTVEEVFAGGFKSGYRKGLEKGLGMIEGGDPTDFQAGFDAGGVAVLSALQYPDVLLMGMLAGKIAKLSVRSFVKTHGEVLNGDEAQLLEIARLREACNKEFESVQLLDTENTQLRLRIKELESAQ